MRYLQCQTGKMIIIIITAFDGGNVPAIAVQRVEVAAQYSGKLANYSSSI